MTGSQISTIDPMSAKETAALMDALPSVANAGHIAVAVSGGADSMALAVLARQWTQSKGIKLTALTVNHGLRPEAAAEAALVKTRIEALGIRHETLVWRGEKPTRNIQALARRARYGLLDGWCAANNAEVLLLAHHLEDQAETVLLRLGRGSGVYGLAGMSVETPPVHPGAPSHIRPLLTVPRARLLATLVTAGLGWVEDPSNMDTKYHRVRTRALWPQLAAIGITPDRLARTAQHMARARAALGADADALIAEACKIDAAGYGTLQVGAFVAAHDEVSLRALSRVLGAVSGNLYGPRFDALERLWTRLVRQDLGAGATLSGCRIIPLADARVLVVREARSMEGRLRLGPRQQVWDGRYLVRAADLDQPLWIDRLAGDGLRMLRETAEANMLAAMPAPARPVVPGIFDARGIVAVPSVNYYRGSVGRGRVSVDYLPLHHLPTLAA